LFKRLAVSSTSRLRIYVLTVLGTLVCIAVALIVDSYSFANGEWRLPERWVNNVVIPLIVAPPFFYFLLSKLRELSLAHRELMSIASTDPLTNCLNRRAFTALVDGYLSRFNDDPEKGRGALLVLDVDHFKAVNDEHGHDRGDEALRLIADTLKANVREPDLVARLGGEEFGIFLPGIEAGRATLTAERICREIQDLSFAPSGKPHPLSLSIGGVTFEPPTSFHELYHQADKHPYAAKRKGRNRVEIVTKKQDPSYGTAISF
jgi:diguanylate cyclase